MIRRLRFLPTSTEPDATVHGAPGGCRPRRMVVATPVDVGEPAVHEVVEQLWFDDVAHVGRFEDWRGPTDGEIVIADEVVVRGEPWFERHLDVGAVAYTHMALATRAAGLSPEEFSVRWRAHAGRARTGDGAVSAIPDAVAGRAYVQLHPRPDRGVAPRYDAINTAYFDDVEGLMARVEWFRAQEVGRRGDELFGPAEFLALREEIVDLGTD